MDAMAGLYVVFEGGEGSGKSTVIAAVSTLLAASGVDVVQVREPFGSYRELLFDPLRPVSPETDVLLFAAGRAELMADVVRPALLAGSVVLSDRSVWSSLAYQTAALPFDDVVAVNKFALGDEWPDLVVWLDVEPAVGLARQTGGTDRFGDQELVEAEAIYAQYVKFEASVPAWVRVLSTTIDETVESVMTVIRDAMGDVL